MPRRFIEPETLLSARLKDEGAMPRWDGAVICFRDHNGSRALVEAFSGRPWGRKVFWGMNESSELPCVYTAEVCGKQIGIVTRCVWGGPQAAILVEELSAMGVRFVIGFGAAGSLDPALPHGTQLVVNSAPCTDGTSGVYGTGPFKPDERLLALLPAVAHVTAATVDAVYRETPELVEVWKRAGARVVNMEAAPFYAAAEACGLGALWIGHVSDLLVGDWQDWYVDRHAMDAATIENCRTLLEGM